MVRTDVPAPAATPPLRLSATGAECGIPQGTLFGREKDLHELATWVAEGAPLVTITGTAGVGKTALARRLVERLRVAMREEAVDVTVCDLTSARDVEGICLAVASAIGLPLAPAQDDAALVAGVGQALAARPAVLVLDNFEQVLHEAPRTLCPWLSTAPELRLVVTSRERLHLVEERVYEVACLPLPEPGRAPETSAAVRLWTERVRAVRPEYVLSAREVPVVVELLRELDGLPLAIELAAARSNVMEAAALLERMRRRFETLSHAARNAPPRHTSLRGAIDASWESLGPRDRSALAQCAIFGAPFSLEAAEAVLDPSAWPGGDPPIDAIQSLRDKSLVRVVDSEDGETRFGLLLAIQDYARERWNDLPASQRVAVCARHERHYRALAVRCDAEQSGPNGPRALNALEREHPSFVAVVDRCLEKPDPGPPALSCALEILVAVSAMAWRCGARPAHLAQLDRALDAPAVESVHPVLRARALVARAQLTLRSVGFDAIGRDLDLAEALARSQGDPAVEASALRIRCIAERRRGRADAAEEAARRALALASATSELTLRGWIHLTLAQFARLGGGLATAQDEGERALALFRRAKNLQGELNATVELSLVHTDAGDWELARELTRAARTKLATVAGRWRRDELVLALSSACHEHAAGRFEEALSFYSEALASARALADARSEAMVTLYAAIVRFEQGALEDVRPHVAPCYLHGALEQARMEVRETLPVLQSLSPRHEGMGRAMLGAFEAESDWPDAARASIDAAERRLVELSVEGPLLSAARMCRGILELAESRRAAARGDDELARKLRDAATARMLDGTERGAGAQGFELTLARRSLARALRRSEPTAPSSGQGEQAPRAAPPSTEPAPTLELASDGRWLVLPNGDRVSCAQRPVMRRTLIAFARAHREHPGIALSWSDLLAAGWPGERVRHDAARNRVRVMISRIRELGLRAWLHGVEEGYFLDPLLSLRFAPPDVIACNREESRPRA